MFNFRLLGNTLCVIIYSITVPTYELMVVIMKNTVSVRMTPYSLVEIYRSFGGKYFFPLQKCSGDRDHSPEISVNFCQTIVFIVPT